MSSAPLAFAASGIRRYQFANRGEVGWVAGMGGCIAGGAHPSKNPRPVSPIQAYIAYARLRCGCGGSSIVVGSGLRDVRRQRDIGCEALTIVCRMLLVYFSLGGGGYVEQV